MARLGVNLDSDSCACVWGMISLYWLLTACHTFRVSGGKICIYILSGEKNSGASIYDQSYFTSAQSYPDQRLHNIVTQSWSPHLQWRHGTHPARHLPIHPNPLFDQPVSSSISWRQSVRPSRDYHSHPRQERECLAPICLVCGDIQMNTWMPRTNVLSCRFHG